MKSTSTVSGEPFAYRQTGKQEKSVRILFWVTSLPNILTGVSWWNNSFTYTWVFLISMSLFHELRRWLRRINRHMYLMAPEYPRCLLSIVWNITSCLVMLET